MSILKLKKLTEYFATKKHENIIFCVEKITVLNLLAQAE